MTGEQILIMILVMVVIGGVAAALVADALRRKDFRDQVEGRRPGENRGRRQGLL